MDVKQILKHIDKVDTTIGILNDMIDERDTILKEGYTTDEWREFNIKESEQRALKRVRNLIIAEHYS